MKYCVYFLYSQCKKNTDFLIFEKSTLMKRNVTFIRIYDLEMEQLLMHARSAYRLDHE